MTHVVNREGYWKEEGEYGDKNLPMPQEAKWPNRKLFLRLLAKVEKIAEQRRYKGYSYCRLCDNERNGASDFNLAYAHQTWKWPEGFVHYLTEHRVRPSIAFEDFITAYCKSKG